MNLNLNQTTEQYSVMDYNKSFKNSPEIREYWRIKKQEERAKAREPQPSNVYKKDNG